MAQSGYTPILIYASGTAAALPSAANLTSSANGAELALNYADGKLYYKNSSGVVTLLASAAAASGTSPGGSNTQVQYNNAGAFGGSANFVFDGTNVGIGTSSPTQALTIYRGSGVAGGIEMAGNGNTLGSTSFFVGQSSSGDGFVYQRANAPLYFGTNNTTRATLDSSGNLGIGVTPSAWSGMTPAVEIGGYGSAVASWGSNRNLYLLSNAYYGSGGFTYKTTGGAAYYNVSGETNSHKWFTAPSGTAGNAITFTQAMTLFASGGLAIGATGDPGAGSLVLDGGTGAGRITLGAVSAGNTIFSTTTGFGAYRALNFQTASSVTMTLDSSGNLGIGTSSPATKVHAVGDNVPARGQVSMQTSTAANFAQITFYDRTTLGAQIYQGYQATAGVGDLTIQTAGASSALVFGTNATERARISAAGGFSVGTTADPGAGAIYATGAITAYYSDARLKDVKGTIANALDKVSSLSGVYYTNNEVAVAHGYTSAETQVGLLAQDVEAVLPEVVKAAPFDLDEKGNSKSGEHYKTIQYERIIPLLVEAIKELRAEVQALRG